MLALPHVLCFLSLLVSLLSLLRDFLLFSSRGLTQIILSFIDTDFFSCKTVLCRGESRSSRSCAFCVGGSARRDVLLTFGFVGVCHAHVMMLFVVSVWSRFQCLFSNASALYT